MFQRVPGVVYRDRIYSGQYHCCAPGLGKYFPKDIQFEAGFEVAQIANDYGLNHWEFCFGFGPWLQLCQERGELLEIEGDRMDLSDPAFWTMFLRRIAFREGWGDAFAEGGRRLPDILGIGRDVMDQFYPAWGQGSHWDGHGSFAGPNYPYWLVTGLQWAMDTRDPLGGGGPAEGRTADRGRALADPGDRGGHRATPAERGSRGLGELEEGSPGSGAHVPSVSRIVS